MKLNVILQSSQNPYLTYPCAGVLEITEVSVYGRVMYATFREHSSDANGKNCKVDVKNPVFSYFGELVTA